MEKFDLTPAAIATIYDKEKLWENFSKSESLYRTLDFTPQAMALFYQAALKLFSEHKQEESLKAFLFLTTMDSVNFDYWLGFGMSLQLCRHYEGAIDAYEIAAFLDVENPVSYFYLSKCFFAIHDRENAKTALEMAIENAGDAPNYGALKIQAQAALALLLKEL